MIEIGIIKDTPENKIIDIRDKNHVIKAKYAIGKDDILKYTLMNEHYIEISFELNTSVLFKRSDYIEWEGERYTLREDYQPEQVNKRKYKYTLKFEAIEMFFQNIQYYYLNQSLKESEWRLTGNAEYFIKIAVDNINRYFGGSDFNIGTIEPAEIKDISFSTNTNTFDALTEIAEQYESEWHVTGRTLHLIQKISFGDEVDLESEVSVLSMKRQEGESTTKYTRIVALGSTRNIPYDYRKPSNNEAVDAIYQKRLRIPTSKGDVIDAYTDMSPNEVVEGSVIFDDIYPKRVGTIEAIGTIEYTDTDEDTGEVTKWNAFKVKDSGINFKEEYVLAGQELKLQFTSGDLNGRDFALKFHKDKFSKIDNSQYFEIIRSEDYGVKLPNDTLKPKAGDEYVLYGFNIALVSDQYVPAAEQELYEKAVEWMQNNLRDTSVYECPTVIKHFMAKQMDLAIGQRVKLIKDIGSNRNLLRNSNFAVAKNYWGTNGVDSWTIEKDSSFGNVSKVKISVVGRGIYQSITTQRQSGETYTISVYLRADAPMNVLLGHEGGIGSKVVEVTTQWQRYTTQGVWKAGGAVTFYARETGTFYIANAQYEQGNQTTAWTPAPEDVEGAIRSSRIMGFEKKLANRYDATYTVGDNAAYSRLASIEKEIKQLQVAGVTYESKGGNGVYLIKQFDNTPASDFNAYSAKASDAKFFNKQTGGSIQGDTLFQKNMQVQGTVIADVFQNSTFTAGQLGSGFQLKRDANGQSYMEVDNLMVRRETVFNKLTIAEIKSVGGTILLSLASMVLSKVEVKASVWKCFFDTADGSIPNDFVVGDQAICRRFTGKRIKYYWTLVTAVGADYIELSKTDREGSGVPAVGDEVVQLGNRTDVNRQYAIMQSAYGSAAPSINQYAGVNAYDLTGKEVTAISPKGNKFTGSFTVSTNGTTAPIYKERGVFVNGTTYYLNDRVAYLGSYWLCIVNNTITTPNETSATWRKETAGQSDIDKTVNEARSEFNAQFIVLNDKIASKVSQIDFNTLRQRVSTSESTITQLAGSITSVVERVNTIKIGGRNLLRNSNFADAKDYWGTNGADSWTIEKDESFGNVLKVKTSVAGRGIFQSITTQRQAGATYTVSVYLRADAPMKVLLGHEGGTGSKVVDVTTQWQRYTTQGVWKAGGAVTFYARETGTFYLANAQYEEGNIATAWQRSIEDVQNDIDTARDAANKAQSTAENKNRTYYQDLEPAIPNAGHKVGDLWYKKSLVDASGNINADTSKNNYQLQYRWNGTTWQQINWSVSKSKIEQTDSSITSVVEKTGIDNLGKGETLMSVINQTPEKITLAVNALNIGGRNYFARIDWEQGGYFNTTGKLVANGNVTRIRPSKTQYMEATANEKYCFRNHNPTYMGYIYELDAEGNVLKEHGWIQSDYRFTTKSATTHFAFLGRRRDNANIKPAEIWNVTCKLEKGDKFTDYTPAVEDVQGQIDSKTTLDEVSSSLTIADNKISLASKTIELTGHTIAKSIEAQDLKVGSRNGLSALEVLKDGTFYAKGSSGENSGLIIDSKKQFIEITSPHSADGSADPPKEKTTITISSTNGSVEAKDDSGVARISANGIFSNKAGVIISTFGNPSKASILALGHANIPDSPIYDTFAAGVYAYANNRGSGAAYGVYGAASTNGTAPAYGGFFNVLKANGLCLACKGISSTTTLNKTDCYISCYNTSPITVYLPADPYAGQVIYLRQMNQSGFTIHSNKGSTAKIHTDGNILVSTGNRAG